MRERLSLDKKIVLSMGFDTVQLYWQWFRAFLEEHHQMRNLPEEISETDGEITEFDTSEMSYYDELTMAAEYVYDWRSQQIPFESEGMKAAVSIEDGTIGGKYFRFDFSAKKEDDSFVLHLSYGTNYLELTPNSSLSKKCIDSLNKFISENEPSIKK